MENLKISFIGLENLRNSININKINKDVSFGVGQATLAIHSALRSAIVRQYKAPDDLNTVLIGKANSTQIFGNNIIRGDLQYKFKAVDLAKFFVPTAVLGNIPPLDKIKEGYIHSVEIVRGRRKIVYGKKNLGGFIPRKNGSSVRFGKFGRVMMFERTSSKAYPLKRLFGPSLTDMVEQVLKTDKNVKDIINKTSEIIESYIKS